MYVLTFLAALLAVTALVLLKRRHQTLSCNELLRRLHPHLLSNVEYVLDRDLQLEDAWINLGSYRGLWQRWRNRVPFVRLCQLHSRHQPELAGELDFIVCRATRIHAATMRAAVLLPLRKFFPFQAKLQLLHTLEAYSELAYHTYGFFADDAPECAKRLSSVL